ncbi:hypothetical protein [Methylobacterium sp. ARG-1]|uniref:hypothetical protein n=1 Tax=Methylobacterium sp. ARG-1 TaxID=1692501 RepID=UPI000681A35C|nr:hypothetical protein [Methylobacterium sp. ARG-1]KNY21589.1 hypothetical protein AKJ13_15155 [Methylobacterium sp. ARG-1]
MPGAFDYARAVRTANRLIAKFGQPGAIRRGSNTSGGDSTNSQASTPGGAAEPTDHPCTLVVLDYSEQERASSLIEQTDRKVLIARAGLDIEPTNDDALVIGGEEFQIITVMPLAPGPVTVLWTAQARR